MSIVPINGPAVPRYIAWIAAACALVASVGATADPARAASGCPASIAPAPGGTGGFDDGLSGEDRAYMPGTLIVSLRRSATRSQVDCVARELGATITDRGTSTGGIGGVRNTVVMSLPAGTSVAGTADRLNQARYSKVVRFAQPDWVAQTKAAVVNDPGFKYQWGLSNQMYIPENGVADQSIPGLSSALGPTNFIFKRRFSVGAARAWRLLRNRPLSRVKVAVIDSGIYEHNDLTNVAPASANNQAGSRLFVDDPGSASASQRITIRGATGGTFQMRTDDLATSGSSSCDVPYDASPDAIKAALQKPNILCGSESPVSWIIRVSASAGGEYRLNYQDRQKVVVERSAPITAASGPDEIAAAIQAGSDGKLVNGKDFAVWRGPAGPVVTFATPSAQITASGISLDNGGGPGSGTVSAAEWASVRSVVGNPGNRPGEDRTYRVLFTDPGAGAITPEFAKLKGSGPRVLVTRDAGTNVENVGRWPCREYGANNQLVDCDDESHGTNVLGMIGATANNGIGVTGTLGPGPARLWMLNPVGGLQTTARAVDYAASELDADVVNMSLGWGGQRQGRPPTTPLTNFKDPDPIDQDIVNEAFSNVPPSNRTLFVVAAGNEWGNLNNPGPTDALRLVNPRTPQGVDQYPCRPKDGGTRSLLQMPDGTYDRGNILCVGAVDWFGRSANFTNWGRGVVDIGAPGVAILGPDRNNLYDSGQGTSYASPIVAGIAAMIYQVYPGIEPSVAKCAILSSATSKPLPPASPTDQTSALPQNAPVSKPFAPYAAARGNSPGELPQDGQAFTVQGMPQADEALSAAGALIERIENSKKLYGPSKPKCVQKRAGKKGPWQDAPLWK